MLDTKGTSFLSEHESLCGWTRALENTLHDEGNAAPSFFAISNNMEALAHYPHQLGDAMKRNDHPHRVARLLEGPKTHRILHHIFNPPDAMGILQRHWAKNVGVAGWLTRWDYGVGIGTLSWGEQCRIGEWLHAALYSHLIPFEQSIEDAVRIQHWVDTFDDAYDIVLKRTLWCVDRVVAYPRIRDRLLEQKKPLGYWLWTALGWAACCNFNEKTLKFDTLNDEGIFELTNIDMDGLQALIRAYPKEWECIRLYRDALRRMGHPCGTPLDLVKEVMAAQRTKNEIFAVPELVSVETV